MKDSINLDERRQHPRFFPDKQNRPEVSFSINGHTPISIHTINICKGGLMGYTTSIEHFMSIQDQYIRSIEITFPGKKPFRCSGRILRLQPSINENKCFCAVEFCETAACHEIEKMKFPISIDSTPKETGTIRQTASIFKLTGVKDNFLKNEPETIQDELRTFVINNPQDEHDEPKKIEKLIIPDSKIMKRVEQVENYAHIDDIEKEIEVRRQAYNSFDDITEHLTIEEKWWFFEMLDEMKRYEPNYPKNLKNAFVELFRTGIKQSQNMQFKLKEKHIVHKL